jgi:hypothetical protein
MRSTYARCIRLVACSLILALTWDGFAHAARPSTKLAALQAAAPPPAGRQLPPAPSATPSASTGISVRQRLTEAHTVFLAEPKIDPNFAVPGTAAYDAVLDALNQWGRYRVVPQASQADLVLQLHGQVTEVDNTGTPPDYTPSVYFLSNLQLTVADPQTLAPLWQVKVPLQNGVRRKSKTLHVATAGENVVSDLKLAAGDQLTSQDRAALKTIHTANTRAIWFAVGGAAAVAGFAVLGIHLVHSHAASFCQQHNLSPCPGA